MGELKNTLILKRSRWPDGIVIARQDESGCHHYWNPGDKWGCAGHVFTSRTQLMKVVNRLTAALQWLPGDKKEKAKKS